MDTQGRRIKKLRLAKGLSQKRLSDMVGIVPTHLQAYEYGTRHPKEEILNRLAKALDVTPSMLQPLDVDTVNGLLGIIYEMHTSYHGLEIVEEDGQICTDRHDLFVSGGTDFHGVIKPDISLGTGRGGMRITTGILDNIKAHLF